MSDPPIEPSPAADETEDPPPEPPAPRRCARCHGPLHPSTVEDTHPCCDPVHGRTVTRWADILHNERVREQATAARRTFRARRG